MDEAATAGVDADMAGFFTIDTEKQQVSGADGAQSDSRAGPELTAGRTRHIQATMGMDVMDKAAAIKALSRAVAAVTVACAELLAAEANQPFRHLGRIRCPCRRVSNKRMVWSAATGAQKHEYQGQDRLQLPYRHNKSSDLSIDAGRRAASHRTCHSPQKQQVAML